MRYHLSIFFQQVLDINYRDRCVKRFKKKIALLTLGFVRTFNSVFAPLKPGQPFPKGGASVRAEDLQTRLFPNLCNWDLLH